MAHKPPRYPLTHLIHSKNQVSEPGSKQQQTAAMRVSANRSQATKPPTRATTPRSIHGHTHAQQENHLAAAVTQVAPLERKKTAAPRRVQQHPVSPACGGKLHRTKTVTGEGGRET